MRTAQCRFAAGQFFVCFLKAFLELLSTDVARALGFDTADVTYRPLSSLDGVGPKAVRDAHLRENLAAADLALSAAELAELDRRFPPPQRKTPLAMT